MDGNEHRPGRIEHLVKDWDVSSALRIISPWRRVLWHIHRTEPKSHRDSRPYCFAWCTAAISRASVQIIWTNTIFDADCYVEFYRCERNFPVYLFDGANLGTSFSCSLVSMLIRACMICIFFALKFRAVPPCYTSVRPPPIPIMTMPLHIYPDGRKGPGSPNILGATC